MDTSVAPSTDNEGTTTCTQSAEPVVAMETGPLSRDIVSSSSSPVKPQQGKSGGGGNSSSMTSAQAAQTPSAFRSSLLRFPVRIGITWKKGERLEAQDFSNTWYPSKIVEINEEEKAVLIHFEGWNQRYDEWFEMASERLRPTTRHSERKDKGLNKRRRVHPHPIYRPGDEVLAKWKDCKKYPAKISRLVEEATYEVIFYDGITHLIQAINIQPLPEEMKMMKAKKLPPSPKTSVSFKQVKLSLPASIRKKQEQRQEKTKQTFSMLSRSKRSPTKLIGKAKLLPKVTLKRDRELDVFSVTGNRGPPTPTKKTGREQAPVTITCEATLSTLSEAECLKLFGTAPVAGSSCTAEIAVPSDTISSDQTGGQKETDSSGTSHPPISLSLASACARDIKGSKKPSASRIRKRAYTDNSSMGSLSKIKKKRPANYKFSQGSKRAKTPQLSALGSGERSKSLDLSGNLGSPLPLAPLVPFIPSKAFIVEEDHNPFKCPYEGCTKDFRKENLLRYHIKYYHTEPEVPSLSSSSPAATETTSHATPSLSSTTGASPHVSVPGSAADAAPTAGIAGKLRTDGSPGLSPSMVSTSTAVSYSSATPIPSLSAPKRRRRKTDSICSTDSEMSASSKSKSSKRHRNDSEISVTTASPEVAGKEYQTDSSRLVQELAAEEEMLPWPGTEEADEEEMALDVVNCTCGQRHHTGLMIQCEVCMCWQHFKCADVKKTGIPPTNYVCLICEKSPGLRDSCKYLHDLGWERRGELPTFSFTQQQQQASSQSTSSTAHLTTLASECNDLLATVQSIKRALHSTRRQIKISKEEDDPEFQLWQTDWDNWTKPEEDLALTPRSAEPDLSPTPSTFLFPPSTFSSDQKDTIKAEDVEEKESAAASLLPAFVEPTTSSGDSPSAAMSLVAASSSSFDSQPQQSPQSSTSLLFPLLSDTGGDSVSGSVGTLTSSSQLFSVSSTPPKTPATASAKGTSTSNMTALDFDVAASARENQPAAKSDERAASAEESRPATNSLLEINITHSLTVNTSALPAPSPSSSLSSAHTSTPPMMLSPVPSAAPEVPQTPSTGRASSLLPSIKHQPGTDSLVKDLFPGPAGDAPAEQKLTSDVLLSKPTEALQSGETETESPTDVSMRTGQNQPEADTVSAETPMEQKALLDTEESQSFDGGPARVTPVTTIVSNNIANDVKLSLTSSVLQTQNESDLPASSPAGERETPDGGLGEGSSGKVTSRGPHPSSSTVDSCLHDDQHPADDVQQKQNGLSSPSHDSSRYLVVNGAAGGSAAFFNEDDEDTQDNDTDTAEESADPYRNCEHNLLVHVKQVHSDVEKQLEMLEARMLELENSEHNNPTVQLSEENILNDVPALKKSLSKLARYLLKVQHLSS